MNRITLACLIALASIVSITSAAHADDADYKLGPDSHPQENVPKGKVTMHVFNASKVFPGTIRRYWVYVPAQYDGKTDAAVMVFQDGHAYVNPKGEHRTTVVFDNLIHKGDMPMTIGVFVDPGHKSDKLPGEKPGWRPQPSNRSFEYDSLSDAYATFIIDELLPTISKEQNLKLTADPDRRAIGGISSGGICAWTVAWERPDSFRKVLSHVGSFTNIRGGHVYPALIRKTKPKPIRAFLQDGEKDLDNAHGNWWLSNLQMEKALKYAKYDYKFVGGTGGHNGKHGGVILPDSLRWLWRDWKGK